MEKPPIETKLKKEGFVEKGARKFTLAILRSFSVWFTTERYVPGSIRTAKPASDQPSPERRVPSRTAGEWLTMFLFSGVILFLIIVLLLVLLIDALF